MTRFSGMVGGLFLAALVASPGGCQVQESPFQTMKGPATVRGAVKPILPNGTRPPQSGAVAGPSEAGYGQSYGGPAQSSRGAMRLPPGRWTPAWTRGLARARPAAEVLAAGDRIVVVAAGAWELLKPNGDPVADGRMGPAALTIDPARGVFYADDGDGFLAAFTLGAGQRRWKLMTLFDGMIRFAINRVGDEITIISVLDEKPPHAADALKRTTVERYRVPANVAVNELGSLAVKRVGELIRNESDVTVAAVPGRTVLATRGWIGVADEHLALVAGFRDEFRPAAMSLDERGNAYLVVETAEGARLWGLNPDGGRFLDVALSADLLTLVAPPILGYDQMVYLAEANHVVAIDPHGQVAWDHKLEGIRGATITADDNLLITAGGKIYAVRGVEPPREIAELPEPGLTAPILAPNGLLLVGAARSVYAFRAVP
ncbi:MAG: hypothetical protein ABI647_06670 [Gemmatimonadota bacterium]